MLQDLKFLFGGAKYFGCFHRFLPVKKLFQKWVALWNQIPCLPSTLIFTPLFYCGVIRFKIIVLKHWVFLEDIWNLNKWKSLIRYEKYWMLWKEMLRKRYFCYQSDKYGKCRKNCRRTNKKESNFSFFQTINFGN